MIIREIINNSKISNQEELLNELNKKGYDLAQATLSRDLRLLEVAKVSDKEKGHIYVLPESTRYKESKETARPPVYGFVSLEFSGNLAVMKTYPGYANSVAIAIDDLHAYEILGTIAGDDTILIIPRDQVGQGNLKKALSVIIPELKNR